MPQDPIEAHRWLIMAAINGTGERVRNRAGHAGTLGADQIAEAQDRALQWAVERGLFAPLADEPNEDLIEPATQLALGEQYRVGVGVPQHFGQARSWYEKAANQGHAEAQMQLGYLYARGESVSQDYAEAYKWIELAATAGLVEAITQRDVIINVITPEQIAEGERRAKEWLEQR